MTVLHFHRPAEGNTPGLDATAPRVDPSWKLWQERHIAAFIFAVGVKNEGDHLDLARLEASRGVARQALAIASSIQYPYPIDQVEQIGRLVIGESSPLEPHATTIGAHIINLAKAQHSLEAPNLAQWLKVWSEAEKQLGHATTLPGSSQWPERFHRGLAMSKEAAPPNNPK